MDAVLVRGENEGGKEGEDALGAWRFGYVRKNLKKARDSNGQGRFFSKAFGKFGDCACVFVLLFAVASRLLKYLLEIPDWGYASETNKTGRGGKRRKVEKRYGKGRRIHMAYVRGTCLA